MASAAKAKPETSVKKSSQTSKRKEKREFNPAKDFPKTNVVLSFLLIALVPWLFYSVLVTVESKQLLVAFLVIVAAAIVVCERLAETLGTWLSTGPLSADPFNNPLLVDANSTKKSKPLVKFKSQTWQLLVHVLMAYMEWQLIQKLSEDGQTLFDAPHRLSFIMEPNPPELETLYIAQMAIWIITGVFHVWVFERQSDYLVMLGHHVATIGLVGVSLKYHYSRFGLLVLFIHDISDISIDLLKLTNYLKLDADRGCYLVEPIFVTNLLTWMYYRMYVLPYTIVYRGVYAGIECAYAIHHNSGDIALATKWATENKMCFQEQPGATARVIQNGVQFAGPDTAAPLYSGLISFALLITLCLMHIYWYFLFLRILHGLLSGNDAHETGASQYEGDDDTEESKEI